MNERGTRPQAGEEGGEGSRWQKEAACAGMDAGLFFADTSKGDGYNDLARRICQSCSVRRECLEAALIADEQYGLWGGLTPKERKRFRRQRAGAA